MIKTIIYRLKCTVRHNQFSGRKGYYIKYFPHGSYGKQSEDKYMREGMRTGVL